VRISGVLTAGKDAMPPSAVSPCSISRNLLRGWQFIKIRIMAAGAQRKRFWGRLLVRSGRATALMQVDGVAGAQGLLGWQQSARVSAHAGGFPPRPERWPDANWANAARPVAGRPRRCSRERSAAMVESLIGCRRGRRRGGGRWGAMPAEKSRVVAI
jgi:hypothetical protein